MIEATGIGWKAHAALMRSGGRARVLARLAASTYLEADGDLLWLGPPTSSRHPRAVLTPQATVADTDVIQMDAALAEVWRRTPMTLPSSRIAALVASCRRLVARLPEIGEPRGLGILLAGADDPSRVGGHIAPLDEVWIARAACAARTLAAACGRADPEAAAEAALPLLGLGPGLTPAGDDYVAAAFAGRSLLLAADGDVPPRWRAAVARVKSAARTRTHPISATLLADLMDGDGHAAVADLVAALAQGTPDGGIVAARTLVAIGHSSGWDMLAGLVAGVLGATR